MYYIIWNYKCICEKKEVPLKIVLEENVRKLILRLTAETQQADYDEGS